MSLSLISGAGTLLGAVMVFCLPLEKVMPYLVGFAAGVMSAVSFLEIIPASLQLGGAGALFLGGSAGILLLFLADIFLGHPAVNLRASYKRLGWLLFIGIALHDFPEGMAIGAGGSVAAELGIFLALAVGIHNVPEGLINAAPLRLGGLSPATILRLNALLSLVTPAGTFFGLFLAHRFHLLIPPLLALAAGAMLYLVAKELTPRMMRKKGAAGFVIGFLTLTALLLHIH
ncbi:MAG: ZIP family metal transporter [Bacillota bacterium]